MGCLCCATWAPRFWTHWMTNRRSVFQDPVWFGWRGFTGGKHVFFVLKVVASGTKKHFWTLKIKKKERPEIEHNNIYIYMCVCVFFCFLSLSLYPFPLLPKCFCRRTSLACMLYFTKKKTGSPQCLGWQRGRLLQKAATTGTFGALRPAEAVDIQVPAHFPGICCRILQLHEVVPQHLLHGHAFEVLLGRKRLRLHR